MSHSMFQVAEYQAARAAAPAEFAAAEALNVWADGQRAQADGQSVLDLVLDPPALPVTAAGLPDWDAILDGIDVKAVDLDSIAVAEVRDLVKRLRFVMVSYEQQGQYRQVGGLFPGSIKPYEPGDKIGFSREEKAALRRGRWSYTATEGRTRTATTRCVICGHVGCFYGPQEPIGL